MKTKQMTDRIKIPSVSEGSARGWGPMRDLRKAGM